MLTYKPLRLNIEKPVIGPGEKAGQCRHTTYTYDYTLLSIRKCPSLFVCHLSINSFLFPVLGQLLSPQLQHHFLLTIIKLVNLVGQFEKDVDRVAPKQWNFQGFKQTNTDYHDCQIWKHMELPKEEYVFFYNMLQTFTVMQLSYVRKLYLTSDELHDDWLAFAKMVKVVAICALLQSTQIVEAKLHTSYLQLSLLARCFVC